MVITYESLAQLDDVLLRLSQSHKEPETVEEDDETAGLGDLIALDD